MTEVCQINSGSHIKAGSLFFPEGGNPGRISAKDYWYNNSEGQS